MIIGEEVVPEFSITAKQLIAVATFLKDSERESVSLKLFISMISYEEFKKQGAAIAPETEQTAKKEILNQPINEWASSENLSTRAKNALARLSEKEGFGTVGDLVRGASEQDMLCIKNCGEITTIEIKRALAKGGQRFQD